MLFWAGVWVLVSQLVREIHLKHLGEEDLSEEIGQTEWRMIASRPEKTACAAVFVGANGYAPEVTKV